METDTARSMFQPDKKLCLLDLEGWEGNGPKVVENGLGLAWLRLTQNNEEIVPASAAW